MTQKEQFRKIIEDVIQEHEKYAPWLKENMGTVLTEFDRRKDTGTFHGVYRFLDDIKFRAKKNKDFFTGYEFCEIESLQMERDTHTAQKIELKLLVDGREINAGRTSLGGRPVWEQNDDHPVCPVCDRNMTLVFQLDSLAQLSENKELGVKISRKDYAFGDVGIVRFFRCIDCNEFASNWECG
ncbi:MAG: hypothetical protein K8R23_03530 [Chthoniobacter sp.]|nr:hypothetical protein [Chthoniobacter sp.]